MSITLDEAWELAQQFGGGHFQYGDAQGAITHKFALAVIEWYEAQQIRPGPVISPHNKYSYRFAIAHNSDGRWEVTDHEKNEVEELVSDEEIWLADRLEVIEATAAENHREVMRLKKIMREHGLEQFTSV